MNALILDRQESVTSEAFMVKIDPKNASPDHVHHDTEQVFYVISGQGILSNQGNDPGKVGISPGEVVRIPPGPIHSVLASSDEPLTYLCVDCFINDRPVDEPTWESHVKVVCRNFGWNIDHIRVHPE